MPKELKVIKTDKKFLDVVKSEPLVLLYLIRINGAAIL